MKTSKLTLISLFSAILILGFTLTAGSAEAGSRRGFSGGHRHGLAPSHISAGYGHYGHFGHGYGYGFGGHIDYIPVRHGCHYHYVPVWHGYY